MHLVADYYEEHRAALQGQAPSRGELWWICDPYTFTSSKATRFVKDQPSKQVDVRRFDPSKLPPDLEAGTQRGEYMAITKIKRRPALVMSTSGTAYHDRGWLGGEFYLVVPARSLRHPTGEYKCDTEFVWGAISYTYSSLFYLPPCDKLRVREGVLHFDRAKALHSTWLLRPWGVRLTADAMKYVDTWFDNYLHGTVPTKFGKALKLYRELLGEDPAIRTGLFGRTAV